MDDKRKELAPVELCPLRGLLEAGGKK